MGKKRFRMMWVILSVIVLSAVVGVVFVNMPQFGRLPRGERLARIERSALTGMEEFRNLHETVLMTSGKGFFQNLTGFLFRKQAGLRPDSTLPVIKTDLQTLNLSEDLLVWFGHSSYLIQMEGKRLLVDPVFCTATCFVRKQTFQRNGGVPAGRYARYRLGYSGKRSVQRRVEIYPPDARIYGSGSQGIESGKNSDGSSF